MATTRKRGVDFEVITPRGKQYDDVARRVLKGPDGVQRLEKTPHDRLSVKVVIEISGKLRRADLDRFAQSMSKAVSLEFEDGGNGM